MTVKSSAGRRGFFLARGLGASWGAHCMRAPMFWCCRGARMKCAPYGLCFVVVHFFKKDY